MSYSNVINVDAAEIIANRQRAIKALSEDKMEQCFSSLFTDFRPLGQSGVTKTQACAVGVLVKEFFGIDSEAALSIYLKEHADFDPYGAVAAKLGIKIDPFDSDDGDVTVRAIWRKNDRSGLPFSSIAGWLKVRWGL